MLRGNYPAKIDDKGRLKLPASFRTLVYDAHGAGLYITSLSGESVRVYPMPVWQALEARLAKMPSTHPARLKFLARTNNTMIVPANVADVSAMLATAMSVLDRSKLPPAAPPGRTTT